VVAAVLMKVHASLLVHLYQSALPSLARDRHALSHRARKQTSHDCRMPAKKKEMFARSSKVRATERRDDRTLLKDKGLREFLDRTGGSYPSSQMVEGMEVDHLAVNVGLHILQDPVGTPVTPVELVKDRVIQAGSLSAMSVVGRVS
jgi:hypothetical protein